MSGPRLFRLSLDVWSLWLSGLTLNVTCGAVLSEVVGSDLGLRLDVQSQAVRYELGCPAAPGQSELGCPV